MDVSNDNMKSIISDVFAEIAPGGKKSKENFKEALMRKDYPTCLKRIEGKAIGKGRFAQRFSTVCQRDHIPNYIENAITELVDKVNLTNE